MRAAAAFACALCLLGAPDVAAQYQPAPTQYTVVNVGGGQTQHFYRDGNRAMVELEMPKSSDQPVPIHMRTIVDVPSKTELSWDLLNARIPCNSPATGDWGDPFGLWQQMALDDSVPPTKAGSATVNGLAATRFKKTSPDGTIELWRDNRYGLLLKAVMTPAGGKPVEMFETKQFKVGPPPSTVFTVPSRCTWNPPKR